MLNIKTKIVFIVIVVLLCPVGANTLVSSYIFTREVSKAYQTEASVIGHTLKAQLDRLLRLNIPIDELIGFDEQCREIVNKYKHISYAMVVDSQGKILFHNNPSRHGGMTADPVILKGIQSAKEFTWIYSQPEEQFYEVIIPVIDSQGRHVAAVRVGFPVRFISQKTRGLFLSSSAIAVFFFLLAIFLLVFALSAWVTKPLTRLLMVIQQIRKDGADMQSRVEIQSRDEIGHLGHAFNEMMNDLEKYQGEIRTHAQNLETRVQERTRELEAAQKELVNKALEAGRAQMSAMVLHNIGNAMTPVRVYVEGMKSDELARISAYLEKCYQDLCEHAGELHRYVSDDPRGKEVFAFVGTLFDSLKTHTDQTADAVNKIDKSVAYISDILTLQQSYVAREMEMKEMADLNRIIDDAVKMQEGVLEKRGVYVVKSLEANLPRLCIDKSRLVQVMVNLIKNSYESFDQLADQNQEKRIMLKSFHEGGRIGFEIKDTGAGIAPDEIASIGELGNSHKDSSGFGLYYSKAFIEANNGTLAISSPGKEKGATVKVTFTLANQTEYEHA